MKSESNGPSRALIVLVLAAVAGIMWLLSLASAYPEFQNTRLDNPLAELNSLFPLYYISIALVALSLVFCWVWRIGNRGLHVLLLVLFAAELWLTPYLITGFVRLPDGPWHVGAAMSVPEVLDGELVAFSSYAWDYPGSFIYHYGLVKVAGIEPLTLITVFPAISTFVFVLLCYALLSRLFGSGVAFLSMVIAIPGLHFIQLHTSPHTLGALLMLTLLLLLAVRGKSLPIIAIVFVLLAIIIVTHPTTPLLISIFLTAALLIALVRSRRIDRVSVSLAGMVIFCFAGWYAWYFLYPVSPLESATVILGGVALGRLTVGAEYLTGTQFIYGNIYSLNKGVYFLYAAVCVLGITYVAVRSYVSTRSVKQWVSKLGGLRRNEMMLALCVPPLLLLSLLLTAWSPTLIESGLTYIILAISGIVASIFSRTQWLRARFGHASLAVALLFLTITFPVVAYSIDAYSNFPKSEQAGLLFLIERGSLGGKSVATPSINQLALYDQQFLVEANLRSLNSKRMRDISDEDLDMVALRNTGYYYDAMRHSLSFDDNRYTGYLADVESADYQKIYSSSTFEVYSKSRPGK